MTTYTADAAADRRPASTVTGAAQVACNHGEIALTVALANGDVVRLCKLPAGHIPVDLVVDNDDFDTNVSPTLTCTVGIVDDDGSTDDPDAFITTTTILQSAGVSRMDAIAARRLAPVDYDRYVAITVTADPATGATSGAIQADLISRPAGLDD